MYKVFLAQSVDLEYIADITNIAWNKNLDVGLNRSGSFSFEVRMDNIFRTDMVPVKNCVIVFKNEEAVWSGMIWNKSKQFSANKMTISCVGWFEILRKRLLLEPLTFTDEIDGDIAFELLAYANAQEMSAAPVPTWITEGTNASTSERTISYEQMQNIGDEIQALTEVESGFDYTIDPLTRVMNIYAWDDFTTHDDLQWAFNWGPNNLIDFNEEQNADAMGNQQFFVGKNGIAEAHDEDSLAYHGQLFQQVNNLTEVADNDILGAYANAELVVKKNPQVIYTVPPKVNTGTNNVPSIFEDYQLGDKMALTARSVGEADVINQQMIRIFGASIAIDDLGNEKIASLNITYQGQ